MTGLIARIGSAERDFNNYIEFLGYDFCSQICNAYQVGMLDNPSSERSYWYKVKAFLNFLCIDDSQSKLRSFLNNPGDYQLQSAEIDLMYFKLISDYRDELNIQPIKNVSKNNTVQALNRFLQICSDFGVIPQGIAVMKGFKYVACVGEGSTLLDVDLKTKSAEVDVAKFLGDDYLDESGEIEALLKNVLSDLQHDSPQDLDIVHEAISTLHSRLSLIKQQCAQVLVQAMNQQQYLEGWCRSEDIIERADRLKSLFDSPYDESLAADKAGTYKCVLGINSLEVLAVFCVRHNDGLMLRDGSEYYSVFIARARSCGVELDEIRRALGFDNIVLAAAYTFFLIEVAGNPESILNLKVDSLSEESEGVYRLWWNKARKGSKSEESEVVSYRSAEIELTEDSLSTVDVFNFVLVLTSNLRQYAVDSQKHNLFLQWYKNNRKGCSYGPSTPAMATFNRWFKNICLEASNNAWSSSPKAIRGSILLLEGMLTRDVFSVQKRARHTDLSMAKKYTYHIPELLSRESKIREFLDWFETLLTVNIDEFADKIGINSEEYETRKQTILNTQFGSLHCSDPLAGIQPGTTQGDICTRIDMCVSCENRRSLFVVSEDNVSNLMHWHETLGWAKSNLNAQQFKRWEVWHLFTTMMLGRLESASEHRRLIRNSKSRCAKEVNPYQNVIPTLNVSL